MKRSRAQSALEFMMTYGWTILVIVIILAVLFYIGVLNPRGSQANTCLFPPGQSCNAFKLGNGTGSLVLDFGQATGKQIRITGISCSQDEARAAQNITNLSSNITILTGEHGWIVGGDSTNGINCTDSSGSSLGSSNSVLGERYKGTLCIAYVEVGQAEVPRVVCGSLTARFEPVSPSEAAGSLLSFGSSCESSSDCITHYCSGGHCAWPPLGPGDYGLYGSVTGSGGLSGAIIKVYPGFLDSQPEPGPGASLSAHFISQPVAQNTSNSDGSYVVYIPVAQPAGPDRASLTTAVAVYITIEKPPGYQTATLPPQPGPGFPLNHGVFYNVGTQSLPHTYPNNSSCTSSRQCYSGYCGRNMLPPPNNRSFCCSSGYCCISSPEDCSTGYYCPGSPNYKCTAQLPLGSSCNQSVQCITNYCSNSTCRWPQPASGQSGVDGVVTDKAGNAIPGATVTCGMPNLAPPAQGPGASLSSPGISFGTGGCGANTTNSDGSFIIYAAPAVGRMVTVTKTGYGSNTSSTFNLVADTITHLGTLTMPKVNGQACTSSNECLSSNCGWNMYNSAKYCCTSDSAYCCATNSDCNGTNTCSGTPNYWCTTLLPYGASCTQNSQCITNYCSTTCLWPNPGPSDYGLDGLVYSGGSPLSGATAFACSGGGGGGTAPHGAGASLSGRTISLTGCPTGSQLGSNTSNSDGSFIIYLAGATPAGPDGASLDPAAGLIGVSAYIYATKGGYNPATTSSQQLSAGAVTHYGAVSINPLD